ncbi:MAG: hypothetical protein JW987_10265 [Anaerolineaceae bacterium]|nr:hypothetical protein [Anaerolineaceae bacterium]
MDSSPNFKFKTEINLALFLVISSILGVILSCVFTILIWRGWFERWEIVAHVPSNTQEIVYGDRRAAYIRTSDDKILRCSIFKPDECWIPFVLPDQMDARPCDLNRVAFSSLLNPPGNLTSCVYTISFASVEADSIIYGIDQDGDLWRWAIFRNGGEMSNLMFMLLLGGFCGLLLGTLLWMAIRMIKKRKNSRHAPLFSVVQLLFLAVPWLCLIALMIIRFIFVERPFQNVNPTNIARHTAATSTATIRETRQAQKWQQVQITPSAGTVRYNFAEHGCDAEWDAWGEDMPCYETEVPNARVVRPISLPPYSSFQSTGKALLLPTTGLKGVSGTFGVIELLEGDHFKSEIGCLDTSTACDISFEVLLLSEEGGYVILGMWQPESDAPQTIDIDLTKFSGRFVRFWFRSYENNSQKSQQDAIWLMPRIENDF